MKNLSFFNVLFLALAIFGISSCGSDDSTVNLGPSVSAEITSLDGANVAPGGTFTVQVIATTGDADLNSLTIRDADGNVDAATRILIDGIDPANNPQIIPDADLGGFTWDLTITAHADESDLEYTFEVADKNGEVGTASLFINTVGTAVAPTVTFNGADPVSVTPGTAANINISATASTDIASIGVWVGGALVDITTEVTDYEGTAMTANPQELAAGFTSLDMAIITIRPTASAVYTFQVTDVNGETGSVDVNVLLGTDIPDEDKYTAVVVNNNSGPEFGGLDLDEGESVSSGNANADLIDMGNESSTNQNWLQQIEAVAGVSIREVPESGDLFNFDNISTKEAIQAAYDNGTDQANTDVLSMNSVFTAKKGDDYYILKVTAVNITDMDNLDNYVIDIKRASF